MSALKAETVRDPPALSALVPDWWELWRRSPSATPFQSPAWLIPWWGVFSPGGLAAIAVREGGRLVGFAPLYVETGRHRRLLPLGIGLSDYCDVLLDPEYPDAGEPLMREAAASTPWDAFELTELAVDAAALSLFAPPLSRLTDSNASESPVLRLRGDLKGTIPTTRHRKLRQAQSRAARRGAVSILCADGGNGPAMLSDLIRLHSACWRARDSAGVFADRRVADFQAAALPLLTKANLARVYALRIGGDIVAIHYGFVHRRRAYAYLQGFDPLYAHESPGTIIVAHAIEQAIGEGATEFHFLRGGEAYKYAWGAESRRNTRRTFIRESADAGV